MKEIKKEKIKKIFTILGILLSMFLFTSLIGYVVEIKIIGNSNYSYLDYLLYLLGYGSLNSTNVWFRLFFSIGSLIALTLFSSACTVTWLESRRILKLNDSLVIDKNKDGEFIASVCLSSKRRDIYGAAVCLVVNVNGKAFSKSTEVAYIPKNQSANAIFKVGLNSVIYKHFSKMDNASDVVATVTYSDMISGTQFSVFEKFSCKKENNFTFKSDAIKQEFMQFIQKQAFLVDFSDAQILDSKRPERINYQQVKAFMVNFDGETNYSAGDFQMLYLPIPEVTEWGIYHDMGCRLKISTKIPKGVTVEVQIKRCDGSILNCGNCRLTKDNSSLEIDLLKYKRSTWENLKELCFVVFYNNIECDKKQAEITIEECAFVLPEQNK